MVGYILCCENVEEDVDGLYEFHAQNLKKEKLKKIIKKIKYISSSSYVTLPFENELVIENMFEYYMLTRRALCCRTSHCGFYNLAVVLFLIIFHAIYLVSFEWQLYKLIQYVDTSKYIKGELGKYFKNFHFFFCGGQFFMILVMSISLFFARQIFNSHIVLLCKYVTKLAKEEYINETKINIENDFLVFCRLFFRYMNNEQNIIPLADVEYEDIQGVKNIGNKVSNMNIVNTFNSVEALKLRNQLLINLEESKYKIDYSFKYGSKTIDFRKSVKFIIQEKLTFRNTWISTLLYLIPWIMYLFGSSYLIYLTIDLSINKQHEIKLGTPEELAFIDWAQLSQTSSFRYIWQAVAMNASAFLYLYLLMSYDFNFFLLKLLYSRIKSAVITFCYRLANSVWEETVINAMLPHLSNCPLYSDESNYNEVPINIGFKKNILNLAEDDFKTLKNKQHSCPHTPSTSYSYKMNNIGKEKESASEKSLRVCKSEQLDHVFNNIKTEPTNCTLDDSEKLILFIDNDVATIPECERKTKGKNSKICQELQIYQNKQFI